MTTALQLQEAGITAAPPESKPNGHGRGQDRCRSSSARPRNDSSLLQLKAVVMDPSPPTMMSASTMRFI